MLPVPVWFTLITGDEGGGEADRYIYKCWILTTETLFPFPFDDVGDDDGGICRRRTRSHMRMAEARVRAILLLLSTDGLFSSMCTVTESSIDNKLSSRSWVPSETPEFVTFG